MFGIGTMELFVILLVGVVVLGPEHLPKIVRTLTKVMSDVRRVSTDFQRTINLETNREEWEQKQAEAAAAKKKKKAASHPETETAAQKAPDIDDAPADMVEQKMPAAYAAAYAAEDEAKKERPAPAQAAAGDAPLETMERMPASKEEPDGMTNQEDAPAEPRGDQA